MDDFLPQYEMTDEDFARDMVRSETTCGLKLEAIQALVADNDLDPVTCWRRIGEIINATGWTIHHILRRQAEETNDAD